MPHRRELLGRFELDDQLAASIDESGVLEVRFSTTKPDSMLLSVDGNQTIAWLTPSGQLGAILVQDYVNAEGSRIVPFVFGHVEIVNDGGMLVVFLSPPPHG